MFWKLPYSDDETHKGCEPVDEVVGHVEELKLVGRWGEGGAHDQVHLHLKSRDLIFRSFSSSSWLTVGSIVPRELSWERSCLKAASLSFHPIKSSTWSHRHRYYRYHRYRRRLAYNPNPWHHPALSRYAIESPSEWPNPRNNWPKTKWIIQKS